MAWALAIAGAAVVAGDMWLVAICWRHQSVLGGVLGVAGIPLVTIALASRRTGSTEEGLLAIALVLLIVGAGLYSLGQALERLLDDASEDET